MQALQVIEDGSPSEKKYLAVSEEEFLQMLRERDELKAKIEAQGMWTLTTAASYVQGHNNTWVVDNILNVPRFRKFLEDKVVFYPSEGARGYLFNPKLWLEFLDKWFPEISRSLKRGDQK